ncbi:ATP-binding cassette domain-containing protein [Cribrihabitans neustonicus]|uniref:ATP-binding cassette domain-containing protein n=1 Tax=Cribrihabitans neustonicus TaxID=1429085 RepID=UPI003B5B4936
MTKFTRTPPPPPANSPRPAAGPGPALRAVPPAPGRRDAAKAPPPRETGTAGPASGPEVGTLIEGAAARIQHRASLLATLAALKGAEVPVGDIVSFIWSETTGELTLQTLAKALATTGLQPKVLEKQSLAPALWPAIAVMSGGQCVLVLAQEGETLTIYDASCPDNRSEVPAGEFRPYFTGTVLSARPSLSQMAARHTPQLHAGHWFWSEFPKYRRQVGEIMLGSLVANVLAVSVALFSLQVYDRVVPHQSHATLWVLAAGAFLAIALEALLKLARARLTDSAGRRIELSVQHNLMRRLIGMRSDKKPLPPSGLFAAMRDFGSVREFFTSTTIATLADIPFIAVFLLLVASIAGPVVWVIIAGGILMLLPAYFMQKKMIALTRQTQGANAKAGRLLHEVVTELDTVKTQRGEERVLRLWDELNVLSSHSATEQRKLSSALTYWSQGIQQATYITAVVLGTLLVFAGEFTVGTIIATGILTSRTLAPLTQFAATLARWSNVKAALEGLDAIAQAPQEKDADRSYLRRPQLRGRFELREILYRYEDDAAPTLDVPAVAITPGQRVAVLGVNGSGKSTLLKLLSGLYAPDRGRILLDGTDMSQIDPRDLRAGIGYLSQDVRLFAGSLRDNLNLNQLERDDERLMQALDFAGLGSFVRGHHKGLDLAIGDGGGGLSIGQRQSIGWARLWLQDPAVVLLDEPTAALDQTLERTLVSRLEHWLQGRTAVIATHRMPILSLTNRTLILQAGRMVVDGPRDQVLAHLAAAGDGK